MISQDELQVIESCLLDAGATKSLTIASLALFFYDFFLTFHKEVQYIWRRNITIGKIAFVFARYSVFITAIMSMFSLDDISVVGVHMSFQSVTILSTELIFALRAWAIWNRSRRILILLICVTTICVVPSAVVMILDIKSSSLATPISVNGFPQCYLFVSSAKMLWIVPYLLIIFFELVTLILTLAKIAQLHNIIPSNATFTLLKALQVDGILYFLSMLVPGVLNIVLVVQVGSPKLRLGAIQLQTVLHSILATRIVFHTMNTTSQDISRAGSLLTSLSATSAMFATHQTTHIYLDDLTRDSRSQRHSSRSQARPSGEDHGVKMV